jgi:hypothetical protein
MSHYLLHQKSGSLFWRSVSLSPVHSIFIESQMSFTQRAFRSSLSARLPLPHFWFRETGVHDYCRSLSKDHNLAR